MTKGLTWGKIVQAKRDINSPTYNRGYEAGYNRARTDQHNKTVNCEKCNEENSTAFDFWSIIVCKKCHPWIWKFCKKYYWILIER